jgi:hypothetical protein
MGSSSWVYWDSFDGDRGVFMDKLRVCRGCGEEKPLSDFTPGKESKDGRRWKCRPCVNKASRERRANNLEVWLERERAHYRKNKKRLHEYTLEYREKNRVRLAEYFRSYHKVKSPVMQRPFMGKALIQKRYVEKNRHKYRAWGMKRHAAVMCQSPPYADDEKIKTIYRISQIMTAITGIKHHVDHIIPMQGVKARGLHHEDNLQVLRAVDNIRKKNKFKPQFIGWELKHVV